MLKGACMLQTIFSVHNYLGLICHHASLLWKVHATENAHFAFADVILCLSCLHHSSSWRATSRVDVDQPVRELVLEVVTLASPVALDVRGCSVVLQTASWARQWLTASDWTDSMLNNRWECVIKLVLPLDNILTGKLSSAELTMTKLYPDQSSLKPTGHTGSLMLWLCTAMSGSGAKHTTHLQHNYLVSPPRLS